ncbi:S41 family peptidase [Algoriphagus sp. NG3]|uniref:S41 family peptidase n=1 Tax=Algoriphagus sp. NG3 TaxID=3097546 RepID=UPI002A835AE6|nr:S41 family peptidase [Algoriphagus sp. NG3]WPR74311.1 S41 family peptidase [Algoriphagus sp. NG3]
MKTAIISKTSLLLCLIILLGSCDKKDDPTPRIAPDSNEAANNWILALMNEVYYWRDDIRTPIAASSDPTQYFNSLLNKPTDRFSAIFPDYQELLNSLSGVSLDAGYEFTLFRASESSNDVVGEITYIKKNSPAASAGLVRGDVFTAINGTTLTEDNYQDVLGQTQEAHTISYLSYNEGLEGYQAQEDISLTPIELQENPIYLDTVYTIGSQKIGYLVYNFFAPDPGNSSNSYDLELDQIFASFKSQNINNLIIDFRYNGGGYVGSAINLASLIAPGVSSSSVFSITKYNELLSSNFPELKDVETAFLNKSQNLGATLDGNTVYVLTSRRTASASELIINGLKPYMEVFMIGDITTGKNVGSVTFGDEENPKNRYGLLPIVSQSFNSLDESDYSNGFTPNIPALEYEERLRPLGDVNEVLLRKALEQITGTPSSTRFNKLDRVEQGSSLDSKIRNGRMIENNILK